MAASKQTYIDAGRAAFGRGDAPPSTPDNASWQQRAFDDGYAQALSEELQSDSAKNKVAARNAHLDNLNETTGEVVQHPIGIRADEPPYSLVGDKRKNVDGSISELVDNGDGTLGTRTTNLPPIGPLVFDARTGVISTDARPFDLQDASESAAVNVGPVDMPTAAREHIARLRSEAQGLCDKRRADRLMRKARTLADKWVKRAAHA